MRLLILSIILVVLHSTDVAAANTPEPTHQEVIEALELLLSKADRKARVADPEGAGGGSGAGNPPPSDRKGDVRRVIRDAVKKVKIRAKRVRSGVGGPILFTPRRDLVTPEPPEEIDPNMSDASETIRALYCEAFPELEELGDFCPGDIATV